MIRVNECIINEKLIKYATPYFVSPKEGVEVGYPLPSTKITFIDNSEVVFERMDINILFSELEKIKQTNNEE